MFLYFNSWFKSRIGGSESRVLKDELVNSVETDERKKDKSIHNDTGLLERTRINGAEDIDLCFKLRNVGLNACVALNSQVGHHVSLSRGLASLNDERNSRLLYHKWRKLLKQELADHWQPWLARGGPYPEPPLALVDAVLLQTPHLAARRVAEAVLVRQEQRWAELLGPLQAIAS